MIGCSFLHFTIVYNDCNCSDDDSIRICCPKVLANERFTALPGEYQRTCRPWHLQREGRVRLREVGLPGQNGTECAA